MTFGRYSISPDWEKVKLDMRVSEGVPRGRIVELYDPGLFQERTYTSMREQIDYINKTDCILIGVKNGS